jgi:hypothetical protein
VAPVGQLWVNAIRMTVIPLVDRARDYRRRIGGENRRHRPHGRARTLLVFFLMLPVPRFWRSRSASRRLRGCRIS